MTTVWRIYDDKGAVVTTITDADVPKKLPEVFQPKKIGKGRPKLLTFKTPELSPKLSEWVEDWKTLSTDQRRWVGNGWSVVKCIDAPIDESQFIPVFKGLAPIARAERFLALPAGQQHDFARLSARTQMSLLLVPSKMRQQFERPDFWLPQLIKYVEHVAHRKERREEERSERRRIEAAKWEAEQRAVRAERLEYDDVCEGIPLSAWAPDSSIHWLSSYRRPDPCVIQLRVTGNDLVRTRRIIDGLEDAWNNYTLDRHVLHMIWFFYTLQFIRTERTCARRYTTKSVFDGSWLLRAPAISWEDVKALDDV